MTEKRFSLRYIGEQHLSANLYDDKIFIGSIGIGAELVVDLLNDLSEENKQLQTKNNAYLQDIEVYREDNTHLKLENDELKKEIESWKKHCITHGIAVPITWGDKND